MPARPVPRNIDKPNRLPEFIIAFIGGYYGTMFLTHAPLISIGVAGFLVYLIHKLTMDKPEGQMYRVLYKYTNLGKFMPSPRRVKRFEV